jgi:hypothetical protein
MVETRSPRGGQKSTARDRDVGVAIRAGIRGSASVGPGPFGEAALGRPTVERIGGDGLAELPSFAAGVLEYHSSGVPSALYLDDDQYFAVVAEVVR